MRLFALSQDASDFYTAGGFWVGVVGTVVGVIAFLISIWQIRKALEEARKSKAAAEAARIAAEETFAETKDSYERFVADHAGRMLTELRSAVSNSDWKVAALRARDLADMFATLPATGITTADATMQESIASLREFDHTFTELADKEAGKLSAKVLNGQWKPLLRNLNIKLDELRAPLRRKRHGPNDSGGSTGEGPGNRQSLAEQNQSRPGELDSEGDK
ncbi:MAG TPA: hypothetical protein VGE74_07495 [Gemmata sp.]